MSHVWTSLGDAGGMTDPPKDTIWTKINVSAAVLVALVALAGLLYTIRSGPASGAASSLAASGPSSSGPAAATLPPVTRTSIAPQPPAPVAETLSLTSLTPAAGGGNVTRKGTTLTMACGTNQ